MGVSPRGPANSTGSLASQRHPGKFPKVPIRRRGKRGFPAAPRERPRAEPSQFSDEETEAQRGPAARPGSHSIWSRVRPPNLGSHGQGLGSPQNAHGHLLPTQQECPGLNSHLLRRSSRQTEPSIRSPRNAGSSVAIPPQAQPPGPQSLVQRAQAGTLPCRVGRGTFGGRRKAVRDRLALQGGTGDFP